MSRIDRPGASSRLTIDLGAMCENYATITQMIRPALCAAVVKADAYGLGALPIVNALRRVGCRHFFTAHLAEAISLLPAIDSNCEVFILNGIESNCEKLCAEHGFVPVLNSIAQVERWHALAVTLGRRLPAALQIDSGMSRLGVCPHDAEKLSEARLDRAVDLRLIMTHLACADDPDRDANTRQLRKFQRIAALFPGAATSIANSSGAFLGDAFYMDLVRPGIALFGVAPALSPTGKLRPVLRLDASVVQVRLIGSGAGVGYGLDHVATRPMRIATIGIGYADGIARRFAQAGAAWFGKYRLPVVGRISMDSLVIDATELPDGLLREEARVELIGPSQSIEVVAEAAGTIPYEILTGLGQRHERRYLLNNGSERGSQGAEL